MSEFEHKQEQLRALLESNHLGALVLTRVSSFAWATCGASSYVNTAASVGVASLVITPEAHYVVTNNIEALRLEKEEGLSEQGWEFVVTPWYENNEGIQKITHGLKLGADHAAAGGLDLSIEMARLRSQLSIQEVERFRLLGKECAAAIEEVVRAIKPEQSERDITASLAQQSERRGVQPIVMLVATDERVFSYRHPLPKDKKLDRYVMVILCGRKWGLVCSITRSLHFGKLPDDLHHKMDAAAFVDATFLANTRPGRTLGSIFAQAVDAYASRGYPGEWKLHHQGGSAGYEPREFVAVPGMAERVLPGQAYAWNPSIQGAKSEDTILVAEEKNEILTRIPGWPEIPVTVNEQTYLRPAILEVT